MVEENNQGEKDCSFFIEEVCDFYNILTDEEKKGLCGSYSTRPFSNLYRKGHYISVYIIKDVYLMRCPCNQGEWFVLAKEGEGKRFEYIEKFDATCSILFDDEETAERLQGVGGAEEVYDKEWALKKFGTFTLVRIYRFWNMIDEYETCRKFNLQLKELEAIIRLFDEGAITPYYD